ncbi:MBL fold metallo-hydrolase [Brevibacillus sp. SYSU BS000544]|uniref:MBL fold metallo-hydrolase n=1 Tax=Brevibacillus sp. SYSU BS000544 TaxID=3416443 RepID=UPI003CE4D22D
MNITKLSWAGVMVDDGSTKLLIDPLGGTNEELEQVVGKSREAIQSFDTLPEVDAILITHIHHDHFDPKSIMKRYGKSVPIFAPHLVTEAIGHKGFIQVNGFQIGEKRKIGTLEITAVESMDGFGFPQVAWLVDKDGRKLLHAGDTLWHGYWWTIAKKYGPIDIACLPINGAVLTLPPHYASTLQEACMTPEQAVEAAHILNVQTLIPIHYGTFHEPPRYCETENALERLTRAAGNRGVHLSILEPLEIFPQLTS